MEIYKKNVFLFLKTLPLLLPLNLIFNSASEWLSDRLDQILRSPSGHPSQEIWIFGGASLALSTIFPILTSAVCLWGVHGQLLKGNLGFSNFIKKYAEPMAIETLRSWGKSLFWGLFFILPGFIALFYYSLVPFVVALSGPYQRGQQDALDRSIQLVKKKTLVLSLILCLFNVLIPLFCSTTFDGYYNLFLTPMAALLLNIFECYGLVWAVHLIFNLYKNDLELDLEWKGAPLEA